MSISRRVALPAAAATVALAAVLATGTAPAQGQPAAPTPAPDDRTSTLAEEASRPLPAQAELGVYTAQGAKLRRVAKDGARVGAVKGMRDVRSRFTKAELRRVEGAVAAARTSGSAYGFYYDPASDSVRVDGSVDRARLPKRDLASGAVRVNPSTGGARVALSRYADDAPHRGGAAIFTGNVRCTSGITVKQANGTLAMVTAGHCGGVGTQWRSGSTERVKADFGSITRRATFPRTDLALLTGGKYQPRTWLGGQTGFNAAAGAAYTLRPGVYYCTSGSTTFEACGKTVVSMNATFCDASGCTYGLVTLKGGRAVQPGDSGGPVVLKANNRSYPRGIIIAVNNGLTYAHNWTTVVSAFGVTSVSYPG
ncbi:hypothetical protein ACQP1U_00785 [Actinomycetota bacterium]